MSDRNSGQLGSKTSALFICDVQERFRRVVTGMPAVIDTTGRMVPNAVYEMQNIYHIPRSMAHFSKHGNVASRLSHWCIFTGSHERLQ
eukprot:scaffold649913_cov46-Prasinocladus_malaysianus.AAC.1